MMGNVIHSSERINGTEIIRRTFSGRTTVEDVIASFSYLLDNGMISNECGGILTDMRNCSLDFNMESFHRLMAFIKSDPGLSALRIAVIVDTSDKIVFPMIASNDRGVHVSPFSTEEAAISWITQ